VKKPNMNSSKGKQTYWPIGWLCWAMSMSIGCGGTVATVTGKATLGGQPVGGAEVVVESTSDPSESFFGMTTEDGSVFASYGTESGMPVGHYKVHVTYFTQRNGQPLPAGEEGQALRQAGRAIGKVYTFEHDFVTGKNELDLKREEATNVTEVTPEDMGLSFPGS